MVATEIWRPAARWAFEQSEYTVRWGVGQQSIEAPDHSRWLTQAANESLGVGFSLSMVAVDEAWKCRREAWDGAAVPTLSQRRSSQGWLISTSGDSDSDLMLAYRGKAIAQLDDPSSLLIIEWSADPKADPDDEAAWRAASPQWDALRRDEVADQRGKMIEPEFRSQYLNQWVSKIKPEPGKPLVEETVWSSLRDPSLHVPDSGLVAALEVTLGEPPAIGLAWRTGGKIALLGVTVRDLDAAWVMLGNLPPDSRIFVGVTYAKDRRAKDLGAEPIGSRETPRALGRVADLVATNALVWNGDLLDAQIATLRVIDSPSGSGLSVLRTPGLTHAARSGAWAVLGASESAPEAVIW